MLASGTGTGGSVWALLSGDRAAALAGPGAAWRELPAPPRGTSALAVGPDGGGGTDGTDALAVSGGSLSVYHLSQAGAWHRTQVIRVPIQYGSSS